MGFKLLYFTLAKCPSADIIISLHLETHLELAGDGDGDGDAPIHYNPLPPATARDTLGPDANRGRWGGVHP